LVFNIMNPLALAGDYLISLAQLISRLSWFVYIGLVIVVVALIVARYVVDAMRLNPFSRIVSIITQPGDTLLGNMRRSRFYHPLRRALSFDPAVIMLLIATALVCYVISLVINYLLGLMTGLGQSLMAFGFGNVFTGVRYIVGTVLLAIIFYLLALMLLVFVYWIFGLFSRIAYRALERLGPLLRLFEFGGALAGWSFLILGIALSFAASAVQLIFLS
jgi:hypothetical protein